MGCVWGVLAFVGLIIVAYITADRWLLLISPESEKRFIKPYVELARDGLLERSDAELETYVADLSDDIAEIMDVPDEIVLEVRLIEGEMANAVTTLGGYIFVTEGLLKTLDNENSLAMVLAHEIAHASERHPLLGAGRGMLIGLLISSLSGSNPTPAALGDMGSQLMLYRYSRTQEEAADMLALRALKDFYGHVGGATQLFERLEENLGEEQSLEAMLASESESELFSTHPNLGRRVGYIEATAEQEGWPVYEVTPYPAAIAERIKTL